MEGDLRGGAQARQRQWISIHALRVEGDSFDLFFTLTLDPISIHALRVEGDFVSALEPPQVGISIHALRVEGDIIPLWYNKV